MHTEAKRILVADDDPTVRHLVDALLSSKGYVVQKARDVDEARKFMQAEFFDLLISDIMIEPDGGMELLKYTRKAFPKTAIIVLTGYACVATALESMREGAFDYIPKPFKIEELLETVGNAFRFQCSLTDWVSGAPSAETRLHFGKVVAESRSMKDVCEMVRRVAPTETTIMIVGGSGNGKKTIAWAIHHCSMRRQGPFIQVSCAAHDETEMEKMLFGIADRKFSNKAGAFEEGKGGTLLLKEIESLTPRLQARVLEVLQHNCIRRVGGSRAVDIDVRVLAASCNSLEKQVQSGQFNKDLFYRLSSLCIIIPPLNERVDDILPLVQYFISTLSEEEFSPLMDSSVLAILRNYSWPVNVRELRNVVQHCLRFMLDGRIAKDALPSKLLAWYDENADSLPSDASQRSGRGKALKAFLHSKEREFIKTVVDTMDAGHLKSARELNITLASLGGKGHQEALSTKGPAHTASHGFPVPGFHAHREPTEENVRLTEDREIFSLLLGDLLHDAYRSLSLLKTNVGLVENNLSGGQDQETKAPLSEVGRKIDQLEKTLRLIQYLNQPSAESVSLHKAVKNALLHYERKFPHIHFKYHDRGMSKAEPQFHAGLGLFLAEEFLKHASAVCPTTTLHCIELSFSFNEKTGEISFMCTDSGHEVSPHEISAFHSESSVFTAVLERNEYGLFLISQIAERFSGSTSAINLPSGGAQYTVVLRPRRALEELQNKHEKFAPARV